MQRVRRPAGGTSPIPFGPAFGAWSLAWLLGSAVFAAIAIAAMGNELGDELSIATLAVVSLVGWATFVTMLVLVSRRYGTGDPAADYAVAFRPIDLVGIPIGVATQFLLVPALYVIVEDLIRVRRTLAHWLTGGERPAATTQPSGK